LKTSDFFFELPMNLIAQFPCEQRGQSRLMTLDRKTKNLSHKTIGDLPDILCEDCFLSPGGKKPLLVFNNTKVRKARIAGKDEKTNMDTDFLLIEKKDSEGFLWKTMTKRAKRKKEGSVFLFYDKTQTQIAKAAVYSFEDEYLILKFENPVNDSWLEKYGDMPLPPYIRRNNIPIDTQRYQTIYANETGSSAAPTAGLHFTQEIIKRLNENGIECVFITLHVGLGTFLPVRSESIKDHVMHEEQYFIEEQAEKKIKEAKAEGRKIIAVGTTSVRTLESAYRDGKNKGSTSIFIYPGFDFKVTDAVITNFHTPESTLLMLVSAFAGRELILESYAKAIHEQYRFFSYGDAMLIY